MAKTALKEGWSFKREILTLFYAFKDARTPWYAKITSLLSLVYLISPVDFVPDLIPFAGYIDDLLVVPFLVNISTRLLPPDVKRIAEDKARRKGKNLLWAMIAMILVVIGMLVLMFYLGNKWLT